MIQLIINTHDFENDLRVMTQAFYPQERIVTHLLDLPMGEDNVMLAALRNYTIEGAIELLEEVEFTMAVRISEGNIWIRRIQCRKHSAQEIEAGGPNLTTVLMPRDSDRNSEEAKLVRNQLKRELYHIYQEYTKTTLPWGTLTGIRPCKIPTKLLLEHWDEAQIQKHLCEEYLTSEKKAALAIEVAKTESKLLSVVDEEDYSLYIGIPFCPTTCLYCSFTSYPIHMWKDKTDLYVEALCKELAFLGELLKGRKADTIYIGGGTPTTLLPEQLDQLITQVENCFDLSKLREFTVEAGRPDSITREKLAVIKEHGIGRISINPQTMNQKTLDLIGRRHTVEDVEQAFMLAREIGFDDINMDLIVGLPGENLEDVRYTLECIKKLKPDNLTVHSLAIKRAARLNTMKEQYADYRIENTDEMIEMTREYAKELGMVPYYLYRQKNMAGNFENVGYATPGKEGIYNILIMEERQSIYAAGANAQSKIVFNHGERVERIENVKDVANYIDRVDEMILRKKQFFNA